MEEKGSIRHKPNYTLHYPLPNTHLIWVNTVMVTAVSEHLSPDVLEL